jgi:four helix bundle protein
MPLDLKIRLKQYSLKIIKLFGMLPKRVEAQLIGKQLFRSGTSVGAQYFESCRAKSDADFINKIESSLQELEETLYWLDLLSDGEIFHNELLVELMTETKELNAILTSMVKKVKSRKK